jgi:hypothetical protein
VLPALAQPEPPPRPRDLGKTPAAEQASDQTTSASEPEHKGNGTCLAALRAIGWEVEPAKPFGQQEGCSMTEAVALKRLRVDSREVQFPDGPVLECQFAERLGHWISDLVVPVIKARLGTDLRAVHTGPGFECRYRNRASSGKLSAHAIGLAVDVAGFELASGDHLAVTETKDVVKVGVLRSLRTGACGWFTTILGPGTDAAHATHWHLDILKHGSSDNYRICQ